MEQIEFLQYTARQLDRLQIPYFVTGSFAAVLYGESRMTNDVDIAIFLALDQVDEFLKAFPDDIFHVNPDAVIDAVKTRFQFNILHMISMVKVDFIMLSSSPHDQEEMRRARRMPVAADFDVMYAAPEDILLKKLHFHKESGSEKHLRDCVGILKRSRASMDLQYLEEWANQLAVLESCASFNRLHNRNPESA